MHSIVLLMWLALCTEQDVRERQISNRLTLGAAVCALIWLFATGHSWMGADPVDAGWALAIVMLLTLPGYWSGRFGATDVKLLGALALTTGYVHMLGTFIGAGVVLLIWLLCRRRLWRSSNPKLRRVLRGLTEQVGDHQPLAPFVLGGALLTFAWIQ